MAQTSDTSLELDQDAPTLDALAPSTHPPIILPVVLPEGSFLVDPMNPPVLGFAPAPAVSPPAVPADRPLPAAAPKDSPAPLTRPKGRFHIGWHEAATTALMLGCAALCLYRLFWAI